MHLFTMSSNRRNVSGFIEAKNRGQERQHTGAQSDFRLDHVKERATVTRRRLYKILVRDGNRHTQHPEASDQSNTSTALTSPGKGKFPVPAGAVRAKVLQFPISGTTSPCPGKLVSSTARP